MRRRLLIAKELLSDTGTIFISLDDNEVAALRLLCDEVFGFQNFIANIIWEKKFSPQNDAKWLSDSHDHILLYAKSKDKWHPKLLSRTAEMDDRYTNPDNDPRGPWTSSDFTVKTASESYMYPIETPSGRIVMPTASRSWVTSEENYLTLKADNRIWFGAKGKNVPRIKTFLSEVQQGTVCKTIWYRTKVGDTQEGTRDLKNVFGKAGMFSNPKPIRLIERILDIASEDNSIILDFFALLERALDKQRELITLNNKVSQSAYSSALAQIEKFIVAKKDVDDIADLRDFCTPSALLRASKGVKGFAAAFLAKTTSSDGLIKIIQKRNDFQKLLTYEEIILVAVNL